MRRTILVGLLAPCCLAAACGSTSTDSGSLTGKTAKQILALSDAAVVNAHSSFHFIDESRVQSEDSVLRGYETTTGAEQVLTAGAAKLEVERTAAGGLFVRGTTSELGEILSLSATQAASESNQWIAVQKSDAPYTGIANTLATEQELSYFRPGTPLHLTGPVQFHGRSVLAVSGRAIATAAAGTGHTTTLYVPTKAPYTPVGATLTFGSGARKGSEAIVFAQWGESVSPTAPVGAVNYASIHG